VENAQILHFAEVMVIE